MALVEIRSANLSSALKLIMDPHKVRAKPRDFFLLLHGFNISFLITPSLFLFYSSVSVAAHFSDTLQRLVSSSKDGCIKVKFKMKKKRKEKKKQGTC